MKPTPVDETLVDKIVATVLYEGYILYPYRASAVKNRQRFNFGTLYPPAFSESQRGTDPCRMRTECLVTGECPQVEIKIRFLQPAARQVGRLVTPLVDWHPGRRPDFEPVAALEVGEDVFQTWQEVVEREIAAEFDLATANRQSSRTVVFPASAEVEPLRAAGGNVIGLVERQQHEIHVRVDLNVQTLEAGLFKIGVSVENQTPLDAVAGVPRDEILLRSLASAHVILMAGGGEFISQLEPPAQYEAAAAACRNLGCWPVLVGETGQRQMMLASPIILYDYPQVAQESDGDFFDGTEIDEMLVLRVMTLTDDEKRAMRSVDARARAILERTDGMLPDEMSKLHGAMRGLTTTGKEKP